MNFPGSRAKDKKTVSVSWQLRSSPLHVLFDVEPTVAFPPHISAPDCQCGGEPRGTVQGRGDSSKQLLTTSADIKTRLTETLPCPGAAAAHYTTFTRAPLGGALQGSAGWGTLTRFNVGLTLELSLPVVRTAVVHLSSSCIWHSIGVSVACTAVVYVYILTALASTVCCFPLCFWKHACPTWLLPKSKRLWAHLVSWCKFN